MNATHGGEERAMTTRWPAVKRLAPLGLGLALVAGLGACAPKEEVPPSFKTPEQAIEALEAALSSVPSNVEELFGPGSLDHLRSGDEVSDREDIARVLEMIREKVGFEDVDEVTKYPLFGDEDWPFPIPLVTDGKRWRFNLEEGIEEIHNRRVGANEIYTLATLHAIVDAQREYHQLRPQGEPPVYAQRFGSEPGTRNGLHWPVEEGEPRSPLGALVAQAAAEGYTAKGEDGEPSETPAYQGYRFRLLTAQGPNAPGGERSFIDADGRMTGGFCALAWPASYGNSGVMTFMVGRRGIVFQKNLGPDTTAVAEAMTACDPDDSWTPTGD